MPIFSSLILGAAATIYLPSATLAVDGLPETEACAMFAAPEKALNASDFALDDVALDGVVLVNIWALWCAPCRTELPLLDELAGEGSAHIVALNLGDDTPAIAQFAADAAIVHLDLSPAAPDDILHTLGAQGLPYNALFVDGMLYGVHNQAIKDDAALRECLHTLGDTR